MDTPDVPELDPEDNAELYTPAGPFNVCRTPEQLLWVALRTRSAEHLIAGDWFARLTASGLPVLYRKDFKDYSKLKMSGGVFQLRCPITREVHHWTKIYLTPKGDSCMTTFEAAFARAPIPSDPLRPRENMRDGLHLLVYDTAYTSLCLNDKESLFFTKKGPAQ